MHRFGQSATFQSIMVRIKQFHTLEEEVLLLQQKAKSRDLSIEEIFFTLSDKGRPLFLIFLSIPFCQPIQIPGLSLPFGLVIALIGLRLALGKQVWLPKKLASKTVCSQTLQKITDKSLVVMKKLEHLIHPRFYWFCHSPVMEVINGIMIFILGVFLALPLPIPLSNLTAAWSIFLLALGNLKDDGVCVFMGYLASFLTLIFFGFIIFTAEHFIWLEWNKI